MRNRLLLLFGTTVMATAGYTQNIGIGTTTPKGRLHINTTSKDTTFLLTADNANDYSTKMIIDNKTMGNSLSILNTLANSYGWGIAITGLGNVGGVKSSVESNTAIWGVNNHYFYPAIKGENAVGVGVIGISSGSDQESAGTVGVAMGDGVGVYGKSEGAGYGIVGRGGVNGSTGKAARFEVMNPNSTYSAVEINHEGPGTLLLAFPNNSTGTKPIAHFAGGGSRPQLLLQHSSISDYARLRMTNQSVSVNQYWDIATFVTANTPASSYINFFVKATSGAGSNVMQINGAGNLSITGTLTQSSDARLKKDVTPLSGSLQKITSVSGYRYHWIDSTKGQDWQTGVLAQEIEQVFPELIKEDAQGIKSVNYLGLVPHLIESIKQQQQQIETLRTELQQLKNNIQQHSK